MTISYILETLLIGPLKLVFEILFSIAYESVGHPGMAIIALSMAMNILVLPLYRQADAMQEKSRKVEEKLHDGVAHIKKTFSGDERMMILQTYYRQNHYSPLSALNGTVSLLLEIPFFIAAYQFLSHLGLLEGVSFGPIADLSKPDGMIVLGSVRVNFLPILMTAVNVVSSAIYLKGFPAKTKVQLYAMAAFFLVFLYGSPSGLLVYWTLNNVFSLVKNIFYKLKNPRKVLSVLCAALGAGLMVFAVTAYETDSIKKRILLILVGLVLLVPVFLPVLRKKWPAKAGSVKPNRKLFFLGCAFLTLLLGALIPSAVIAASPQEFVDLNYFYSPALYVAGALLLAAGTFLVWLPVFYWLAEDKGKALFDKLIWCGCGLTLVNYMFFGTNLGLISAALQYENYAGFSGLEQVLNLLILLVSFVILYWVARKWERTAALILVTASIAVGCMSAVNLTGIQKSITNLKSYLQAAGDEQPHFTLSKQGKNVVVLMCDRAMGASVPYIFQEKPELKEQFAGFTYYDNTISFGEHTVFGVPAMMGGYEYTPVEMNKRDGELLKDKHNEALKVMPRLFQENGYDVTVCDAPYAGYQEIPDLSIYDDIPGIHTYWTHGRFNDIASKEETVSNNNRNFFCFSLMKCMPVTMQPTLYDGGRYHSLKKSTEAIGYAMQKTDGMSRAEDVNSEFLDGYNVLRNLSNITWVTREKENTFLFLCNDATHDSMLLQEPEYIPAETVDNTVYDGKHEDRFYANGKHLIVENAAQMASYHANMAMFLQVGQWLQYLRDNGVYDNTRIILVSDHGHRTWQIEGLTDVEREAAGSSDLLGFFPLLMVKDFDSRTFQTCDTFMTNADVPSLAMEGLIDEPVNPFTGKGLNMEEKTAHPQFASLSHDWEILEDNRTVFPLSQWASVQDNAWNLENWAFYPEQVVLKEHAAP